jgi:hypothetical protein
VLSGGTTKDDLHSFGYRPEIVVESLAQLAELLDRSDWSPTWYASSGIRINASRRMSLLGRHPASASI